MKRIRKACWWMGVCMLIGGILHFSSGPALFAAPKGVLKVAIHWDISADWMDPSLMTEGTSAAFVPYLMHDALLKPMAGDMYAPSLAESWTISPDARVYEFKLRRGVKFHNGDEFTADDVVFSFKRVKGGNAQEIQSRIEKLESVNPYLFRVTFKGPFPNFLDYSLPGLGTIAWVVPKKYIEKVGDAEYKRRPVGCGPYKLVEYEAGVKIIAEAFEGYWRKQPNIRRLEFYSVKETATRYAMVKRGEVDLATLLIGTYFDEVKKDPKLRLLTPASPTHSILYIGGQFDPKSPWADPRVRKAASLAIDRQTIVDIHGPGGATAGTVGLKGDPMGVPFEPDPYNPEAAKKLLAEAGYPKGFDGGKYFPSDGPYWPMGEMVGNYLKAIGISFDTVKYDRATWYAKRRSGDFKNASVTDMAGAPTIESRLAFLFGESSFGNYPDIQDLWDKYNKEVNPKTRKDLIARIQRMIHDRTMFIPIFKVSSPAAAGPRLKGNPFKVQEPYPVWFVCPMEDLELNE